MRKIIAVVAVLALMAADSDEARARRVYYWKCAAREKCRESEGACCGCQCAQTCGLIKNGCGPECSKIIGNPLEVSCGN